MLGKLALQRTNVRFTHLTALAVMAALVVGLFGLMGSSSAATGDVDAAIGICVTDGGDSDTLLDVNTVAADNTPSGTLLTYDDGDSTTTPDPNANCPTGAMVGDWVSVTPVAGNAPDVEIRPLQVTIDVTGDSDLVVSNSGTASLTANLAVSNWNATSDIRNLWIKDDSFTVEGALGVHAYGGTEIGGGRADITEADNTPWAATGITAMTIPVPSTVPNGEYKVSVLFLYDHDSDDPDGDGQKSVDGVAVQATSPRALPASKIITVANPGQSVDSVSLSLAQKKIDDPATVADESNEGAAFGPSNTGSTSVRIRLSILNSLGNAPGGSQLSFVTVSASGADVALNAINRDGSVGDSVDIGTTGSHSASASGTDLASDLYVTIDSKNDAPRVVAVTATAIGKDGSSATTTLADDLNFTGGANALSVTAASASVLKTNAVAEGKTEVTDSDATNDDTDHRDRIGFVLGAEDSAGNTVGTPDVRVTIMNEDGGRVSTNSYADVQTDLSSGAPGNKSLLLVNVDTSASRPLPTGEYTLKVTNKKDSTQSATTTFNVVGTADDIALMVNDDAPSTIGAPLEVSVMVSSGGAPVADGTRVRFQSRDTVGDTDSVLVLASDVHVATKNGEATATFVVIGSGSAVITATADGKVAVKVITSTAGAEEPEAMPEEEASVSCLSNLSGFSTWSCGVESSAVEIFGLVSGRGASAVHLWNGSEWVRYSVVEGAMVPGSSDFMVTEDDILYISN